MPDITLGDVNVHYRDEGSGAPVVLAHSSTASGGQWRAFIELMSDRYRLLSPDLHGYGGTGPLAEGANFIEADADIVCALIALCDGPVHLVGHSLGGAVVARAAMRRPGDVASLTLIEPTMFFLLGRHGEAEADREIRSVGGRVIEYMGKGDVEEAARGFIDYWIAPGAFNAMAEPVRAAVQAGMPKLRQEWLGAFDDIYTAQDIRALAAPLLILSASGTTLAARKVVEILRRLRPDADYGEITGGGHMSPVTHPHLVNPLIEAHILRHTGTFA